MGSAGWRSITRRRYARRSRSMRAAGVPIESPSGLTYLLGTGEKGRLQVEIEIKGSSAHASVPWQGTNAMYSLHRVLQRIEAYEPERDTSYQHIRPSVSVRHRAQAVCRECG